jgi:glycine/D-amino acid oxidase-like deaminating enzyme
VSEFLFRRPGDPERLLLNSWNMTLRGGSQPLWLTRPRSAHAPRYPALRGDLDVDMVDVVIIGGGVTGAAVAWKLASGGIRVAVLEAQRVGRGSTAASTALLMQEPDEDFGALRERYGTAATRRIWQRSARARDDFIHTLKTLGVACDLAARDSIYYTVDDQARLRRELTLRRDAGLSAAWLDAPALEHVANITGGVAIRTTGNAQADPYRVCVGLLDAAEQRGAAIFEHTRVTRIDTSQRSSRSSQGVTVHTPHGRIRADQVVIATGYATPAFKPLLRRFRMSLTYVVATERLSPSLQRRIGLSRVMLWDTDRPYHYARWTTDGRLLLGGGDRPIVPPRARPQALREGAENVRAHFARLYPALEHVTIERAWDGMFASTPDGLPFVGPHRRYPRHLFALGYGGNGMTFGFLAAEIICERLLGRVTDDHALFSFGREPR